MFNIDNNAKTELNGQIGVRLSQGSGSETTNGAAGYLVSGYMKIPAKENVYFLYLQHKGTSHPSSLNLDSSSHGGSILAVYDSEKVFIEATYVWNYGSGQPKYPAVYNGEITYDADKGLLIIPLRQKQDNYAYYRISLPGTAITDWAAYIDQDPRDYEGILNSQRIEVVLDSAALTSAELSQLKSSVENIAEDYLNYEDDPEIVIEPEWEAHIGTIDGFFSNLKQNLEETYIGGEQNVNA